MVCILPSQQIPTRVFRLKFIGEVQFAMWRSSRIMHRSIVVHLVASKLFEVIIPNHMYFEVDFKVFKMYFQYLNTILLYFNPI